MALSRRRFVRLAALGTAATLTGPAACGAGGAADAADVAARRALARPDLLDVLGPEQVRAIGARYRAMVPAEADADALVAALQGRFPRLAALVGQAPPPPAERSRRDFDEGRTVEVEGWVLSLTEARQCALYSLGAA